MKRFYTLLMVCSLSFTAEANEMIPDGIPSWLHCQSNENGPRFKPEDIYINFPRKHVWRVYKDSWAPVMDDGTMDVRYTSENYEGIDGPVSLNLNGRRGDQYIKVRVPSTLSSMKLIKVSFKDGLILGEPEIESYICKAVMKPTASIQEISDAVYAKTLSGEIKQIPDTDLPKQKD
jgi:hypothetical protein